MKTISQKKRQATCTIDEENTKYQRKNDPMNTRTSPEEKIDVPTKPPTTPLSKLLYIDPLVDLINAYKGEPKHYTESLPIDKSSRLVAGKFATRVVYQGIGQLDLGVKTLYFNPEPENPPDRWAQSRRAESFDVMKRKWQLLKLPASIRKIELNFDVNIPLARLRDIKELQSVDRDTARLFYDKCIRRYTKSDMSYSFPEFFKTEFDAAYGWPKLLEELVVGYAFNSRVDCLPASLKKLTYAYPSYGKRDVGFLPVGLTHFTIYGPVVFDGKLPENLTHLTFGGQSLRERLQVQTLEPGFFPSKLTHLTFCGEFNGPIDPGVLPQSLTHLTFDCHFDQPIKVGVLPQNLQHLELGGYFNHPIDPGVLPASLLSLSFGEYFDCELAGVNVLPPNLVSLKLGRKYHHSMRDGFLKEGLRELELGGKFKGDIGVNMLPASLKKLTFGKSFNQPIQDDVFLRLHKLTHLTFGDKFNQIVGVLPLSLTHLTFGLEFNMPVEKLPSNLVHLKFGDRFNWEIGEGVLPTSLKLVAFGRDFNRSFGGIPPKLQHLTFGQFYQPLGTIPSTLTYLKISSRCRFIRPSTLTDLVTF